MIELRNRIFDLDPAEPRMQLRKVINFFKFGSIFFDLIFMWMFGNYSQPALLITALHGSYGFLWIFKDSIFPDPSFNAQFKFGTCLAAIGLLSSYALIDLSCIANTSYTSVPKERFLVSVLMFVIGVFFMIGSDAQKFFVLRVKKGLITDGFFCFCRNPNYLGETLIYLSFAVVANSLLGYLVVGAAVGLMFFPNMWLKDESFSSRPGFNEWKKNTYLFAPKLFESDLGNALFYGLSTIFIWFTYLLC